jgi:hypothetical protein
LSGVSAAVNSAAFTNHPTKFRKLMIDLKTPEFDIDSSGDRTPSPAAFSFRPMAEEDNAPTERDIVYKTVAADQIG